MLPTLNLQISPVELTDDTLSTPAGANGDVDTGFADLLRNRVSGSLTVEGAGGELLPQGGSALPLPADFAATELTQDMLRSGEIHRGLTASTLESGTGVELPELVLTAPVPYPPLGSGSAPGAQPVSVLAPSAVDPLGASSAQTTTAATMTGVPFPAGSNLSFAQPRGPETGITPDGRQTALILSSPAVVPAIVRDASPLALADGAATIPATTVGLRELGHHREPPARTGPITLTTSIATPPDGLQPAELTRRIELPGILRADAAADGTAETLQPRLLNQQSAQTPQPQLNMPLSQSPLISASQSTAVAPDLTYGGLPQPTTDLISTSVRESAWGNQLGERVVMMASNQLKSAEIRLTPAELGPLRVQISVDDGAAHVTFHAQHAVTRDAIEQALPRLREMLAENGLSLGQADVSDRGVGEGSRDAGSDDDSSSLMADSSEGLSRDAGHEESPGRTITPNGLVDTFA